MKNTFIILLILFSFISCNKHETKYDLNIQIKSTILPANVILYKNDEFSDSLKFQIDGTIGYWAMDIESNSKFELKVIKSNPLDRGKVFIKWFRTSNFAKQDILEYDSVTISKSALFTM
jgi:hypothetical protein